MLIDLPEILDDYQRISDARLPGYAWIRENSPVSAQVLTYDDPLMYLHTGRTGYAMPILHWITYAGTPAKSDAYFKTAAEFMQQYKLEYALVTAGDFRRDLQGDGRRAMTAALGDQRLFEREFTAPGATVFKLSLASSGPLPSRRLVGERSRFDPCRSISNPVARARCRCGIPVAVRELQERGVMNVITTGPCKTLLLAAIFGAVAGTAFSAQAQKPAKSSSAAPPTAIPTFSTDDLSRTGIFYAGGKYVGAPGKEVMGGSAYVEVWLPKQIRHPYPIIYIHGAGQTATDWQQTPDGRPGWAYYFAKQGYVQYMVDSPARGRSPYVPDHDGNLNIRTAPNLESIFTASAREAIFRAAISHTVPRDRPDG